MHLTDRLLSFNANGGMPPVDLLASFALGAFCAVVLVAHRAAGAPNQYRRVTQQGATFFLGFNVMHAGYWMLQPVVRRCVRHGITPAAISWCSLLPALAAAFATATGHWGATAWCLLVSALLDVLDGAVARAIGKTSAAGAVLDSVLDRYAEFFFFAGVFISYRHDLFAQLITLTALLGSFLITYSTAKAEALGLTPPRGSMKRSDRLTLLIVGAALAPLSHRWLETPSTPLAWPVLIALTVIAVLGNLSAIRRFTALAQRAGSSNPLNGIRPPQFAVEPHSPIDGTTSIVRRGSRDARPLAHHSTSASASTGVASPPATQPRR